MLDPSPRTNLTAPAVQNFGEPLTLTCEVTTLRGITSGVTIEWITYGHGERRRVVNVTGSVVNNTVVYRDLYHIPRLTTEGFVRCQGIINTIPIPAAGPYDIDTIRLILTCK